MSIFSFFVRRGTAPVARERLQILLAHERVATSGEGGDVVALLREEILAVIAKHFPIERDRVQVKLDRGSTVSTLEIGVEMPVDAKLGPRARVA
ncbi:cell division topological specificity factor MinE [Acidisphaera rubrifaciens]|uniref:Cell division topological specificity factor n=1 Tax=Acidisphaera rubrifaciens HS-AP3 TaxID=1231350 RepID=A0A0D6P805_9PROT|nr:cell division topological specificity factor MinE [Acidisphaera rubrifaciens]GAN76994.1 cell division topological specificity factor MinE [Acidisphaera rubrifaciens HS-AP3]